MALTQATRHRYGVTEAGAAILPPDGWRLLTEGETVPSVYRECNRDGTWCAPRRCTGTMTPIVAGVSGYIRAFAVPLVNFHHGKLASYMGRQLFLKVLKSAAGYYIGTADEATGPVSRESVEYWYKQEGAEFALASGRWTQRVGP